MIRTYGFGVYGLGPYGGVASLEQFVFLVPELKVNRGVTAPFHSVIDVLNPPDNGSIEIYRANDVRSKFTLLTTVAISSLPFTDTTANPILNHKYMGRYQYIFNGRLVTQAPVSPPIYTFLESNAI
jgi:hypothetical protein